MALAEGQVQVRGLVMGPGTPYAIESAFNPWTRSARVDQSGSRSWGNGSWSGAEWMAEAVVPVPVLVDSATPAEWLAHHQRLAAAFAPSHSDIELRWTAGGVEFLLYGRPRLIEPDTEFVGSGAVPTRCAFVATDPTIYGGAEYTETLGLPTTAGGLALPMGLPTRVTATVVTGRRLLANAGTADVGLALRVNGPVASPSVSLLTDAGTATLRFALTLDDGQWLDVDTAVRTVYLNGLVSRRGFTTAEGVGWPALPSGAHEIAFNAPTYNPDASLSVAWRDAWT